MNVTKYPIKTTLFLLKILPLRVLHCLANVIGTLFYYFPNSHKRITKTNLKLVFSSKKEYEINKLTRLSLIESSKNLFETSKVWYCSGKQKDHSNKYRIEIEGIPKIKKSLSLNLGLILFAPHMGNIEIIINYLARNYICTIPYTPAKSFLFEDLIFNARKNMGVSMIKANQTGVKSLLSSLKNSEVVAIASDQVPKKNGVTAKFFQIPALTMTLVPRLAVKTKSPCHSVCCLRLGKGKGYKIIFGNRINSLNDCSLKEGLNLMNTELEKCIMKEPEQYAWEYKRFKHSSIKSPYT